MNKKRIISLAIAILEALAAIRVLLEAIFIFQDHYAIGQESLRTFTLEESKLLVLTCILMFGAYRFAKYFVRKQN